MQSSEIQYLDLLQALVRRVEAGDARNDRTGTGIASIFAPPPIVVERGDFPALLTKSVYVDGVVDELLWFLSGSTNVYDLGFAHKWWAPFADGHGDLGPTYGAQLRGKDPRFVDQLSDVFRQLKSDPHSRRHVISNWDAHTVSETRLPPCHGTVTQFFVTNDGQLEMHTYQRSADVFIGLPVNLMSYSILHHLFARSLGRPVGRMTYSLGDAHLYLPHAGPARVQLSRRNKRETKPRRYASLHLAGKKRTPWEYQHEEIAVRDYFPLPSIRGELFV